MSTEGNQEGGALASWATRPHVLGQKDGVKPVDFSWVLPRRLKTGH